MKKLTSSFSICLLKCGRMFFLLSDFEVRLGISQVKFCCLKNLLLGKYRLKLYRVKL